jgi:hypothetical protein
MNKVNLIDLGSDSRLYALDDTAYALLRQYLEWTRFGLEDDPERDEALRDLERLIGEKLAGLLHARRRVIRDTDLATVFAELGTRDFGTADQLSGVNTI